MDDVQPLRSCFAKIKNIDGKALGKDGKHMKLSHNIHFVDTSVPLNDLPMHSATESLSENDSNIGSISKVSTLEDVQDEPAISISVKVNEDPKSFASILNKTPTKKVVKLVPLTNDEVIEGKRLAFPIVENYLKKAWAKYGIERVMLQNGFFFFQFSSKDGMEKVLENGPWLIRLVPIILNVWTLISKMKKDEITTGLSIVIAIPINNGLGHTLKTIKVEYEWQPTRCATCKTFDHQDDKCPKKPKVINSNQHDEDGFVEVTKKKRKGKQHSKPRMIEGIRLTKPKPNYQFWPVNKHVSISDVASTLQVAGSDKEGKMVTKTTKYPKQASSTLEDTCTKLNNISKDPPNQVSLKNSFSSLMIDADFSLENEDIWVTSKSFTITVNDIDSEEIDDELVLEEPTVINENNLCVCAILESHVASFRLDFLCSNVFRFWNWSYNGSLCSKGSRIILGWNPNDVDLVVISQDAQVMHTLLGDFNVALNIEDKSVGSSKFDIFMREFKECVEDIEVSDVNYTGLKFTWNQKPKVDDGVLKKIDRIMANLDFYDAFVGAYAIFQPYRISDHAPAVLKIPMVSNIKPKTFKFSNVLVHNVRFKDLVKEERSTPFSGFHMYQVVKKLKHLKKPLRKLLYDQGNLHQNVKRLRAELDHVQLDLDKYPFNHVLREEETVYVNDFNDALMMEERFLKQKAKIEWLRVGDSNSAYFHKVPMAFVTHYSSFLGQQGVNQTLNSDNLFINKLDSNVASNMVRIVSTREVKEAIFSMGNDKSPGPDGYTVAFFKEAWDIVSNDVTKAVKEFFINGNLLKVVNHTIIALIPKVASPSRINDYRPISCRNVIYKCISKILANRIKVSLTSLVSPNQSAFVPVKRISDNILLTQKIMHNYHLDRGPPRCAFKVDIESLRYG
ncbi:hypothetical protein Tco_1234251 [Tanacetum coccineum]